MGELEFQQRWELRRNEDDDLDSSFNDSKSSSRQLKKLKLVSSLVSVDDEDKTSETSRFKLKGNGNPGTVSHIHIGKANKFKTRNVSNKSQSSKLRRDCLEEVDLQKDEISVHVAAPLDELKSLMESLLKDLKVTREDLLKWMLEEMQKLVADYTHPEPKRRNRGHGGKKIQLQQMKKSKKFEDQHGTLQKESTQFQHPNTSEKSIQVQHITKFREPVLAEQQNKGFPEGIIAVSGSTDNFNGSGDRVMSGQVTELITSSKQNKGDTLSIYANPYLRTSSDRNVKLLQDHKSVVLAIEAQKGKGGSLKRIAKGKETVDCNDHHRVPKDQGGHSQAMTTAVTGTNGEKFGSSFIRNFLPSLSGQPPLSTVLTEPIVANQGLDASFCNYILPSSNQGPFPVIQPEERTRSFALMGSKNMGPLDLNNPSTSGIGTGFAVPFHQAIDAGSSITREINPQYLSKDNSKPLSLMMNGGSYNLSELIASNNHHCFISYQMQNIKDGDLFRQ